MSRAGLVLAGIATIAGCTVAYAQQAVKLEIESQPLDKALNEWASQTGYQVLVPSERIARGRTAPSVKGTYTPEGALKVLLAKSDDLRYQFVNARTVTIRTVDGATPAPAAAREEEGTKRPLVLAQSPQPGRTADQSTTGAPSSRPNPNNSDVAEVVVTAQKREERLLDTPQSVSVLSSDALTRMGALQFRDYASTVPGLSFTTSGAGFTQVSLRGVTAGQDVSATVGIYVDDVPYGSSSGFSQGGQLALDVGLFDLNHIEVLRGPQGTLYGASTMGGLLKYVTRRPNLETLGFDVQTGISSAQDGGMNYNGAIAASVPLVEGKVGLRASGFYSRDGGFIDNVALGRKDINSSDIYGQRFDLLIAPTDLLSVRLSAFLQNVSRDGQGTADFLPATGEPEEDFLDQYRPTPEALDQRFRLGSATVALNLGAATLTSISSFQTARTRVVTDVTREFQGFLPQFGAIGIPQRLATDKFTQEIRLSSDADRTWQWLVGGFYTRETSGNKQEFLLRDLNGEPVVNTLYTFSSPSKYEEYAGFVDLTYRVTEKLDVSGGVRYANNRQSFKQIGSGLVGSFDTRRSDEGVETYLANARYHFTDRSTGYLRFATGYRPGGPNFVANDLVTGAPLAPETFEADRLKSYEAGFKMETANRAYSVDVAAFYIDWSNIQILATRGIFSVYANAPGGATIRGGELALTARPLERLSFTGSFSYQRAELSEADPDLGGADGERLPNVPRFTGSLNADYRLPLGSFDPYIGATVRYTSDRLATFNNAPRPQFELDDYTSLNVRAGARFGSVDLQLFVHNVLNEEGALSASTLHLPAAQVSILPPRTVGISATAHF